MLIYIRCFDAVGRVSLSMLYHCCLSLIDQRHDV